MPRSTRLVRGTLGSVFMPRHWRFALVCLGLSLLTTLTTFAQAPPTADTFSLSSSPTNNYSTFQNMAVEHSGALNASSYVQFNLSTVPAGATVAKATLRLYVDLATVSGQFDVYQLNTSWGEKTLTYNNAPALGTSATGNHPITITTASLNQFVVIDITPLVQSWINGSVANNGVALAVVGSTGVFAFDTKESITTSHHPELEIALAGPAGPQGPQGPQGATGPQGPQGLPGNLNPGSPYYIQNGTATQSSASFNVDGSGTAGGTLTGTTAVNTNGTYQIGGNTVLQNPRPTSLFVGPAAGQSNFGTGNTFVGTAAGALSTTGAQNTFLGNQAGLLATVGGNNTFVGLSAGMATTTGNFNTYVGTQAGCANCAGTGNSNIYIGPGTGSFGVDESSTIRIGNSTGIITENTTYIAGIYGSNSPSGVPVFVNSSGQLGTGGGGGGFVTSFNGRTGAVVPAANDYSFSQLSGALGFSQLTGVLGGSQINGSYNLGVSFGNTGNSFTGNDLNVAFANIGNVLTAPIVNATLYNLGGQTVLTDNNNNTNIFVGAGAGFAVTGQTDTFVGNRAGVSTTSGIGNTFLGWDAGYYNLLGNNNTYLGAASGCQNADCFAAGSNNIYIGANAGTSGADESNTLRIGGSPGVPLGAAYISGIYSATSSSGIEVFINSSGQLGTQTSSVRFKEQVQDMGDRTSKLFQLRPVTFFYKAKYDDGSHMLQYGLIAEEVAKVYPDLVAYDKDGQPYTVKYQLLAAMLLNELQKQHAVVAAQQEAIKTQQERVNAQQQQMQAQRQEIDVLNLQLQQQNASLQERLSRLESYVATQAKTASDNPPQKTPGANGGLR